MKVPCVSAWGAIVLSFPLIPQSVLLKLRPFSSGKRLKRERGNNPTHTCLVLLGSDTEHGCHPSTIASLESALVMYYTIVKSGRAKDHKASMGQGYSSLTTREVDEACFNPDRLVLKGPKKGGKKRYLVYSKTDAGRYILVVLEPLTRGEARVVTARDLKEKEKRFYRERRER